MDNKKIFRYQAIYNDIKEMIESGAYQGNELLPPEKDIAAKYDVDRSTVRKALQMLADQGLVMKCPGKGSIVNAQHSNSPKFNLQQTPPKQNFKIGFLLSRRNAFTEQFYSTLFNMLENELQRCGCSLIYSTFDDEDQFSVKVNLLGLDGVIFVSNIKDEHIEDALRMRIPCVLINSYHPSVPSVLSDNEKGAYLICKYLIEKGHRDILALSGVRSYVSNQERLAGYKRALSEAGIPVKSGNILVSESWEFAAGTDTLFQYLNNTTHRPTAIFGLNDRLASGAMLAIHQAGLRVPDDISVVGYDNLNDMRFSFLRMTTIEAHIELMAEATANLLLWQINGGHCMPLRVTTPVEIVAGQTVKSID